MTIREQQTDFVKNWQRAGTALRAIRFQELREFRHEEHMGDIEALLELGTRHATPRLTSGLIEQQRLFRKAGR